MNARSNVDSFAHAEDLSELEETWGNKSNKNIIKVELIRF
jgi:hypothetical protein